MKSVKDAICALFPRGTTWPEITDYDQPGKDAAPAVWSACPIWPPDVFAVAAHLLELSGAYHHIATEESFAASRLAPKAGKASKNTPRRLLVTNEIRTGAQRAGAEWLADWASTRRGRGFPDKPPSSVARAWKRLIKESHSPLFEELDVYAAAPRWWKDAYFLFAVADEASRDLGFGPAGERGTEGSPLESFLDIFRYLRTSVTATRDFDNFYSCSFANQNIACVMPKSRTPRVGCTLRSLSHNLALMPPQGEVRVRWFSRSDEFQMAKKPILDTAPLKFLIVPFPYTISQVSFEDVGDSGAAWGKAAPGWFQVRSAWLSNKSKAEQRKRVREFASFIGDLIRSAGAGSEPVNAVVLPEAALSADAFEAVRDQIVKSHPSVELLISGTVDSKDTRGRLREGNFVDQCMFVQGEDGSRVYIHATREKHHRWKLTGPQIRTYELQDRLDPDREWWERIDITGRSLDLMAFRPSATVTSLICEDLARVDPCQDAVRAVGPTLLIALLMDSSQLTVRWPARYATVLVEDPGTSVLTVTSLGLVNMTRLHDGARPPWSIALWRDEKSAPREIILKPGYHAVCVTLRAEMETEGSLDGRHDGRNALLWQMDPSGPHQIRSTAAHAEWITGGCE